MSDPTLPALDWQRMPLEARVLIEASAGTGKTFTIGLIYLRLLLERGLGVEHILVATFTDAAAQELRERLRRRLVQAERWLEGMECASDDPLFEHLRVAYAGDAARAAALRRVRLARADFDRAPIATFHALCQRIQRDFPLQSGAAFGIGAATDETALLRECVEDFWRRRFLGRPVDPRERTVLEAGPDDLLRDLGALLARDARVLPADGLARIDELLALLGTEEAREELHRLSENAALFAPKTRALRNRLQEIADGADLKRLLPTDKAKYFDAGEFEEQISSAGMFELAPHALLAALRALRQLLKDRDLFPRGRVLAEAYAYCRAEIPRRARSRDTQTFSMLIDDVHARLCSDGGVLAARLAEEFPAALIDEFQDTDRRQFEILDRVFRAPDGVPRGLLVMIGDPKQAIFGFRGGDIAAYLRASAGTAQRFALGVNRRSSTPLVHALNALYSAPDAFGDPRIRYHAVEPAGKADATPYTRGGRAAPALLLHDFAGGNDAASSSVSELEAAALEDCADRIAELLNDTQARIGERRIGPGDIAVLLPKNAQIAALRERLAARRVPCVGSGRGSVFATETARELDLVLAAVADPGDEGSVRGAATTRLLGATYADVLAWQENPHAFESELERFAAWHELVRARGVLALIEALCERCAAPLLARGAGERTLTDLRHLGELLAQEEGPRHGLEGMRAWLSAMRREAGNNEYETSDARVLRIESDAQRVKLLTLHNAKGLEFPLVFVPLAWRRQVIKPTPGVLRFHDDGDEDCVDLGSAHFARHRTAHFREELQERMRLLYVALTRAKYAVHVYWTPTDAVARGDEESWKVAALDRLLGPARHDGESGEHAGMDAVARTLGVEIVPPFVGERCVFHLQIPAPTQRRARAPLPELRPFRWMHSFSSIVRRAPLAPDESRAADEIVASADPPEPDARDGDAALLALEPLRGARFGDAVHEVFESAEAGAVWPDQDALVRRALGTLVWRGQAESDPAETVGRLVDRVRGADLGGVRLDRLSAGERVAEFEFQLPLHGVHVARLREICAAHGCEHVLPASLAAEDLHGMLTGFVDLVFTHDGRYHVLDYKTNRLGVRRADYEPAALERAMREHRYELQALLYTLALHRHLGARMDGYTPERDLGESWYLFVRAVGLAPNLGVWRRRWPPALIRELDEAFARVAAVPA